MRKESLENVTLSEHIESKKDSAAAGQIRWWASVSEWQN